MKTVIIVGIIVLLLSLLAQVLVRQLTIKGLTPISSIADDGTLGIKIGDSRKQVEARVRYLKIWDKVQQRAYKEQAKNGFSSNSRPLVCAQNSYQQIKGITCSFNDKDLLESICISIDCDTSRVNEDVRILCEQLSEQLGRRPRTQSEDLISWGQVSVLTCEGPDNYIDLSVQIWN